MLKTAFDMGMKVAYDEEGLTPEQMLAAQRVSGVGGGLVGAGAGGALGQYLGGRAAEAFDMDNPAVARAIGGGLGALAGGGLGGFVGSQVPQWKYPEKEEEEGQEESALGALPIAYNQEPYLGLDYGGGSDYGSGYDGSSAYDSSGYGYY